MGRIRKGTNVCSVCTSERRHLVEIGLVNKVPAKVLAAKFGLSHWALHRHRKNHLTPQMAAAILAAQRPSDVDLEKLRVSESEGLIGSLLQQRARLALQAEQAMEAGAFAVAVSAEKGITANLELLAKLLGQLVTHHEIRSTSILISADYLNVRQAITAALRPFPEAARAVAEALHRLESAAAEAIKAKAANGKVPLTIEHQAAEGSLQ